MTGSNTVKGFTLVELAIALMVIGLLIGGVLKGKEIIENARVTATMRMIKESDSASSIFVSTYGALPGDFEEPGKKIPNCNIDTCNTPGNGDGVVGRDVEACNFFPHMTKSGLLKGGPEGGRYSECIGFVAPMEEAGGVDPVSAQELEWAEKFLLKTPYDLFLSYNIPYGLGGYNIPGGIDNGLRGLSGKVMQMFDTKFDDGMPYTGSITLCVKSVCSYSDPTEEYDLEYVNDKSANNHIRILAIDSEINN